MPDAHDPWTLALDWQSYLEQATAQIESNALARAVREELRGHLEAERLRATAEGADPDTAARRAMAAVGDATVVAAAMGAQHGSHLWRRALWVGTLAGAAVAVVGQAVAAVQWVALRFPTAPWREPWLGWLALALQFAPLGVAARYAGRRAGREPIEVAAGAASIFGFVLTGWAYDLIGSAIGHMVPRPSPHVLVNPLVAAHTPAILLLSAPVAAVSTYIVGAALVSMAAWAVRFAGTARPLRATP